VDLGRNHVSDAGMRKTEFLLVTGLGKREIAPSVHPALTVKTRQCGALISDYISDAARFIDHIFIYKNQKVAPIW